REQHRTIPRRQTEARMQHRPGTLQGLAVEPNEEELSGRNGGIRGEGPLGWRAIGAKIKTSKALGCASLIVDFNPRIALTKVVSRSGQILWLNFIQPNRREWRQSG